MITWILTPTFFIALGGAISLFGTIWAAKDQAESEKSSKERAEKALSFMLGSHSFSYDHKVSQTKNHEILTIFLKNIGEYPCYSLTFRAIDIDAYGFEEIQDIADILKKPSPIYEKHWVDLPSGTTSQALSLTLVKNKNEHNFKIFLNSRKDRSSLKIRFVRDQSGSWTRDVKAL